MEKIAAYLGNNIVKSNICICTFYPWSIVIYVIIKGFKYYWNKKTSSYKHNCNRRKLEKKILKYF
jgi:hypothetical protein